MSGFEIVNFTEAHLPGGVALSQAVGWSHRHQDWKMLLDLSEGSVALMDDRVIGTALRSDFGASLSAVNMIIVDQNRRGQGVGRALVEAVMQPAGPRAFRLVATVSGRPLYEKLGFAEVSKIRQLQGHVRRVPDVPGAMAAVPQDMDAIARIENATYGGDRSALVAWLWGNAQMAVIRSDREDVVGYAACRRFGLGHVIGPMVAPDLRSAKALLSYFARDLVGAFLRLDIASDSALVDTLHEMGLDQVDLAPVMQRGSTHMQNTRVAFFSQALG